MTVDLLRRLPRRPSLCTRLGLALLALMLPPWLGAQTTSTIEGSVRSADGQPLPGVAVTATGAALERATVTNREGRYQLRALPAGTYSVTASIEGFATETREGLELALNRTAVLDFDLRVGSVEETVTVTAEVPLIKVSSADTGGIVTPRQIETLPVNGRNYLDLLQLIPGVTINRQSDEGSDLSTPILGERAGNTIYLIDGMPNRDEFGSGPSSQFNQDTIFEFEVITDGFKAEFGHGSGGVVNVVTRSGGNQVRGLGFAFARDDALDSSNSLDDANDDAPELERQNLGFNLGGPLIVDRLFAYGSLEGIDEERQLNFAFPRGTPQLVRDFERGFDRPTSNEELRVFFKLTEQIGSAHTVNQHVSYNDQELRDFLPLSQSTSLPSTRRSFERETTMVGITDTSVFGDGASPWIFDGYLQYRDESDLEEPANLEAGPSTVFNLFSSTTTFGVFGDLGAVTFGSSLTDSFFDQEYVAVGPSLSRSWGDHQVEAGFDYLRTRVDGKEFSLVANQLFATEENFLRFGPVFSGFFTLLTLGGLSPEDSLIRLRNDYTGVYLQDDWQVTDTLTLNLGLRWDRDSEFADDDNFAPRFGVAWTPTPKTVVRASYGLFYDRFRLGLVRDIPDFGGADLRTIQPFSYPQLFYNLTSIAPVLFGVCVNPLLTQSQIDASGAPCPLGPFPHFGFDALNSFVAPGRAPIPAETIVTRDNVLDLTGLSPEEFLARVNASVPLPAGIEWFFGPFGVLSHTGSPDAAFPVTLDPGFETPYTRGWHVGVQQQIGSRQMVSIDYHHKEFENVLGVRTTNLAFVSRITGNERTFEEPNTTVPINGFGPWYEGELDAVTVSYTRRLANRFSLSAHYTYTDAEDNLRVAQLGNGALSGSGAPGTPSDTFVGIVPEVTDPISGQNNRDGPFTASNGNPVPQAGTFYNGPDLDRGTSSLALEHSFVLFGLVELPAGFQVSAILRLQSGFPFSRNTDAPLDVDGNINFNTRDLDFERNSFEAPSFENLDLRLAKRFGGDGSRVRTTVLLEFFNVFNEQNPAAVETTPGRPIAFGQPLQVLPGREGQVGLRFEF
ncbi:MAG TPA: TonB-dependent receptor [Thermoanaerobaculia bacterium]|nr:TonB-dependent receptor [Thermoanaerobaculia bacterium]